VDDFWWMALFCYKLFMAGRLDEKMEVIGRVGYVVILGEDLV
jgi:hypothetical protein